MWIRSTSGELLRSDVITWLQCRGGEVQAARPDGTAVRLAGPGCPRDFHVALPRGLEARGRCHDDRLIVVITAEITTGSSRWASARLDEVPETDAKAIGSGQSP